jgi:AcrR family transcriptional regulator
MTTLVSEQATVRSRIISAAIQITTQDGWSQLTMAHLADVVGVSRQTVYNEVGTKAELAEAMVNAELAAFLDVVDSAFHRYPTDPFAAVDDAIHGVVRFAHDNPLLQAIVRATPGTQTDLLPLLTTNSENLMAAATMVLAECLARYPDRIDVAAKAGEVDAIVRLVLSHITQPGPTPQRSADQLVVVARTLLGS